MDKILLNIIVVLHALFVLFVIISPFADIEYFLLMHSIFIPFMILHWILNDNNCALTVIEKHLRYRINGVKPDPDECFSYNLIAPIYDFKKNNSEYSNIIYNITITLWIVTLYKLYKKYKNNELQLHKQYMRFYSLNYVNF